MRLSIGFLVVLGGFILAVAVIPSAGAIYSELTGWQAGIGAIFGLLAILIGALLNAQINRKRDDRIRNEKRRELASTLGAEIYATVAHLQFILELLKATTDKENGILQEQAEIVLPVETPVFDAVANQVGGIGIDAGSDIIKFYQAVKGIAPRLRSNVSDISGLRVLETPTLKKISQYIEGTPEEGKILMEGLREFADGDDDALPRMCNKKAALLEKRKSEARSKNTGQAAGPQAAN